MEGAAGPRKLPEGTMLDDKYRIERLLAVGGMGAVYVGTHIKLRKRVAIKLLNPQLSSAPMIERFHREAITASQIGHEGIAQVTDLGTSSEGEPFLVMEYLEGESLASRLRATGPLAIEDACELGCAILSPLAAAHRAGIVHRDLKPDNVFLVRQSRGEMVKLLDFGISRASGFESEFRLTTTGLVLGTPYYMSPEQARGDGMVTPASDLYAFGVMLYEMLIGSVPIQADNYNQLMYRVMMGDFAPPRSRRADLPEALERVILQAMALDPLARPGSAIELEQALLAFCRPAFRDHLGGRLSSPGLLLPHAPGGSSYPRMAPATGPGSTGPGPGYGTDPTMMADSGVRADAPARPTLPDAPHAKAKRARWPKLVAALVVVGGVVTAAVIAGQGGSPSAPPATTAVAEKPAPAASEHPAAPGAPTSPPANAALTTPTTNAAPTNPTNPTTNATPTNPTTNAAPTSPPSTGAVTPASGAPAAPPGAAPATITLRFAVEPAGAAITIDGKPVRGGELAVAPDTADHALRITAPGHQPHEETVRFDESQRLSVQLKRAAEPARGKPKTAHTDRIDSQSPYD